MHEDGPGTGVESGLARGSHGHFPGLFLPGSNTRDMEIGGLAAHGDGVDTGGTHPARVRPAHLGPGGRQGVVSGGRHAIAGGHGDILLLQKMGI